MKIALSVKSPTALNKVVELAMMALAKGGYVEFSVDVADAQATGLMRDYIEWASGAPVPEASRPAVVVVTVPDTPTAAPGPAFVAPAPAAPVSGQLDAKGTPWNESLHAAQTGRTGGKNEDGEWKMRRGGDRNLYNAWKAKHAVGGGASAPAATTVYPSAPVSAPPVNPFAMPAAPSPAIEDPGSERVSAKASELAIAGKLTPVIVSQIMAKYGVTDNGALLNDPNIRPRVWLELLAIEAA